MSLVPMCTLAGFESSKQIVKVRRFPQVRQSQYRQSQHSDHCNKKEPIRICQSCVNENAKSSRNSRCKHKGSATSQGELQERR